MLLAIGFKRRIERVEPLDRRAGGSERLLAEVELCSIVCRDQLEA